jgi:hypothetical protein
VCCCLQPINDSSGFSPGSGLAYKLQVTKLSVTSEVFQK